ncbi:MAG: HTH-type transcriptional repressor DasR [Pseudomonas sp.]|nr:MAG: HTH-type transcriptional repressor DasR [Pseudomonas sp.]
MNSLSSDVRLPLYQRLRDHLVEQIASSRWRPGEAIPTEAVLSTEYQLSTGTVRKAMDTLVNEGILERQQGRGTFVRRPRFQASLFRFFRFPGPSVPDSCIVSVEPMPAPPAVAGALGLEEGATVIRILRVRLPVLAEELWLPHARFHALLDLDLKGQGPLLYPIYEATCGQVVASAEETLSAELVCDVHAGLLQLPAGSPVVVIERLARDYSGQPLEWRRACGHAGHFHYRIEIR